jgi:hypothetical protein
MQIRNSFLRIGKVMQSQCFMVLEQNLLARNFSTSSSRSNEPLNLTDLPRRLLPDESTYWMLRMQILYNMLTVDMSFRFRGFREDSAQVKNKTFV